MLIAELHQIHNVQLISSYSRYMDRKSLLYTTYRILEYSVPCLPLASQKIKELLKSQNITRLNLYETLRGPIFRRSHGMPRPPNGSLNESLQTPVCNKDISIFIQSKHRNIVRHELLTFRLPFGGHGIPWKRLKQVFLCI